MPVMHFCHANLMLRFPTYKVFYGKKSKEACLHDMLTVAIAHRLTVPKLLLEFVNCLFTSIDRGQYPPVPNPAAIGRAWSCSLREGREGRHRRRNDGFCQHYLLFQAKLGDNLFNILGRFL